MLDFVSDAQWIIFGASLPFIGFGCAKIIEKFLEKKEPTKRGIEEGNIVKGGHNETPTTLRPDPPKGQGK